VYVLSESQHGRNQLFTIFTSPCAAVFCSLKHKLHSEEENFRMLRA